MGVSGSASALSALLLCQGYTATASGSAPHSNRRTRHARACSARRIVLNTVRVMCRFRQRRASRVLIPSARLRSMNTIAGGCIRACVTAIMWMVELRRRLPQRLSRWRVDLPEETGNGAVPTYVAKAASPLNREAPATWPTR